MPLYDFPHETTCQRFAKNLLGSWSTESGNGTFPTIMPFRFGADFIVSKPNIMTKSQFMTTNLNAWAPGKRGEIGMFSENGFLRCVGNEEIELSLAHSSGSTEVLRGYVTEGKDVFVASLDSTHIGNSSEEKQRTKRILEVSPKLGILTDTYLMSTAAVPSLTEHLKVAYTKKSR